MKTLRLILGDQLNQQHSWYNDPIDNVIYFMAEMRQETDYTTHHIQKVVAFFESMQNFANWLESEGHSVIYFSINSKENKQDLIKNIKSLIEKHNFTHFEYQLPDEYRLDKQLSIFKNQSNEVVISAVDTEHFLTTRTNVASFFKGKKQLTMEYFYRDMRKKHDILMITHKDPEGGKWNFDHSNRNKYKGKHPIPSPLVFTNEVKKTVLEIEKSGIKTIGTINPTQFDWPTNRDDCLSALNYFCENLLEHFGDYQDALYTEHAYLFHSRLSFAMNSKMLHPKEVIETVITYWRNHKNIIDISQVEGFIRQILGWREYMRGIYWMKMPGYALLNKLENFNKLPNFYWSADTKMNCLHHAIKQSLDKAYAHHIQRLMITGNFALLAQINPDEVDEWYLGIYIDAIEWVEITNTRGMSQFADGGIVATKPYVSSGSYINKMSNYCGKCFYNVKLKTEDNACPFNSLYWNFLDDKRKFFKTNNRMAMMMNMLNKKSTNDILALKERAAKIIENPDHF
ncbi:cryptochrome/photolyase family protein [Patiriisocius marinistellae]|uniref:Cryptochrome/photolyase family protein n=1 Tax=Patiriisocius marinistellae TaxID=2494560 RepID=A0A5J4G2W3_9FLAO|nr:cryptochrome/photolyase family protein [Patiriisocius marinistellae]GEQ87116.1 cryptochrome/photolyase family protein [Patiriisocius marinistellae]